MRTTEDFYGDDRRKLINSYHRVQIHAALSGKTFWGAFALPFASTAVNPSSCFSSVPHDTHSSTVFPFERDRLPPFFHTSIVSDQLASGSYYYPQIPCTHTSAVFQQHTGFTSFLDSILFFSASAEGDVSYRASGQGRVLGCRSLHLLVLLASLFHHPQTSPEFLDLFDPGAFILLGCNPFES